MARIVFIQGLIAWISFCIMLTVIYHRQIQQEPLSQTAGAHEFGSAQINENGGLQHHILKPPPKRNIKPSISNMKEVIPSPPVAVAKEKETTTPVAVQEIKSIYNHYEPKSGNVETVETVEIKSTSLDMNSPQHPKVEWLPDLKLQNTINDAPISVYMVSADTFSYSYLHTFYKI